MESIKHPPVLITGASGGVGFATALHLAKNGRQVIALSRNRQNLDRLASEAGPLCRIIPFDLVNEKPGDLKVRLQTMGVDTLSGIIHNAGFLVNKPFQEINTEELNAVYSTNVFAPFLITQALLPFLRNAKKSHVLHISSMGGVQGSVKFPGLSAYSSSKGALSILTECLATELAESGIAVNCIALGAVQTEMLSQAFPGYTAPLQPSEIAPMISWFFTEGANYFNGKILPVALSTP